MRGGIGLFLSVSPALMNCFCGACRKILQRAPEKKFDFRIRVNTHLFSEHARKKPAQQAYFGRRSASRADITHGTDARIRYCGQEKRSNADSRRPTSFRNDPLNKGSALRPPPASALRQSLPGTFTVAIFIYRIQPFNGRLRVVLRNRQMRHRRVGRSAVPVHDARGQFRFAKHCTIQKKRAAPSARMPM